MNPIDIKGKTEIIRSGTLWVGFILILSLSVWYSFSDSSYIGSYDKETQYVSSSYAKKVNLMLDTALQDFNPDGLTLNEKYHKLKFNISYKYDPSIRSQIIDWSRVRLIGFIPQNQRDSIFYFNSYFEKDLIRQKENLNEVLFNIKPSREGIHIDDIEISGLLHNSKLDEYFWEGNLTCHDHNLFDSALVVQYKGKEFYIPELDQFPEGSGVSGSDNQIELTEDYNEVEGIKPFFENYKNFNTSNALFITEGDNPLLILHYANDSVKIVADIHDSYDATLRIINSISGNIYFKYSELKDYKYWTLPLNESINVILNNRYELIISNQRKKNIISKMIMRSRGHSRMLFNNHKDSYISFMADQIAAYQDKLKYSFPTKNEKQYAQSRDFKLSINKTLNELILKYLEDTQSRKFPNKNIKIGITLMDPKTGELLSIADYDYERDSLAMSTNVNFTNHWIGSTFKPILATSCISVYPTLQKFKLRFGPSPTSGLNKFDELKKSRPTRSDNIKLLGYEMPRFDKSDYAYNEQVAGSFDNMFNNSLNIYPNALLLLALSDKNSENQEPWRSTIQRNIISGNFGAVQNLYSSGQTHSSVLRIDDNTLQLAKGKNLHHSIFGLSTVNLFGLSTRELSKLTDLKYSEVNEGFRYASIDTPFMSHIYMMSPDRNTMHFDHMTKWKFRPYRGHIVSWVLGAGSNEWSNIKLAEAYSRIISRNRVIADFAKRDITRSDSTDLISFWLDFVQSKAEYRERIGENDLSYPHIDQAWDRLVRNLERSESADDAIALFNRNSNIQEFFNNDSLFAERLQNDKFTLLGKTGSPNTKIDTIIETTRTGGRLKKYRYRHQGLYAFSLMLNRDFERLQDLDNYADLDSIKTGIVGVIYIAEDEFKDKYNPNPPSTVSSKHAVNIFSNADFIKSIILLNNELFI